MRFTNEMSKKSQLTSNSIHKTHKNDAQDDVMCDEK